MAKTKTVLILTRNVYLKFIGKKLLCMWSKLANCYAETTKVVKKCWLVYGKIGFPSLSQLSHVLTLPAPDRLKWHQWLGWMASVV